MGDICNICGKPCSSVPWIHDRCYEAMLIELSELRVALETAESERDRFRAALSTPEWDSRGDCQLCANRFAYVHSLGCPRQRQAALKGE